MNVKPGSTFIVSTKDIKTFDKDCIMYMVNCTASGRYRVTWLRVPVDVHELKWQVFMSITERYFHRYPGQIMEGYQSIYTIRRKDYGDLVTSIKGASYHHIPAGNVVLAVRRCVK